MSDRGEKVDLNKLSSADRELIARITRNNIERVAKLKRVRRNNLITGSIIGSIALAIYGYTIFSVKQETFLDDFNEPEKTTTKL